MAARTKVRKVKFLAAFLLFYFAGAATIFIYEYASFSRVEIIKRSDRSDRQYQFAHSKMIRENPDFASYFQGKIEPMTLATDARRCYFFYKKSAAIFEGGDLIYCFDRHSGNYLGRL